MTEIWMLDTAAQTHLLFSAIKDVEQRFFSPYFNVFISITEMFSTLKTLPTTTLTARKCLVL